MEPFVTIMIQAVAGAAGGGGISSAIKQIAVARSLALLMGAVGGVGAGLFIPTPGLLDGDVSVWIVAIITGMIGGIILTGILGLRKDG